MTLEEILAKMAALHEAAQAVIAAAGDEELTEEQQKDVAAKMKEYKDLKAKADVLQAKKDRQDALRAAVSTAGAELEQSTGRILAPAAPATDAGNAITPVTSGLRPRLLDDPKGGFRDYGDFCRAVIIGCGRGVVPDERLLTLNAAYGQNTEIGAEGGFQVPAEFSNRMIARMGRRLGLLEKADVISMTSNSVEVTGLQDHDRSSATYRYGGVVVYFVGEAGQITRSTLKTRKIILRLVKIAALSFATEEEIKSVANQGERLFNAHSAALGDTVEECVMFGTGVGQPMGAFSSPCCIETAAESGQPADTIVYENLLNLEANLAEESDLDAEYFYNAECGPQLETMVLSVGTGGVPVMTVIGGAQGAPFRTIKGRAAHKTNHCAALGDAGDLCLGDFSKYLIGMRGNEETALSMHLRFDYMETAFRTFIEIDGQPYYEQSLRPRKGATAKRESPFVKIAARA